jgi:hypothetical protein
VNAPFRQHRSTIVLASGALGLAIVLTSIGIAARGFELAFFAVLGSFIAAVLGLFAVVFGWRQIRGMRENRIDPSGRVRTRLGQRLGTAATVLAAFLTAGLIVFFPRDCDVLRGDGTILTTEMYYRDVLKARYTQATGSEGHFVKEGPWQMWSRSGTKIEEGGYHENKRDGRWTFWNESGRIDTDRSGVYRNDVRIGPPEGDFSPDD